MKSLPFLHTVLRVLALSLLCSVSWCAVSCASQGSYSPEGMAFVAGMGCGWNLGNTFDALPNGNVRRAGLETENAWGNPKTMRKLISYIREQGFETIRIPISWHAHTGDAPDYTIDPAWMDRVDEVVTWALEENLYVIINMHHERAWLEKAATDYEGTMAEYRSIWDQITQRFRDRSDRLIFESMSEIDFEDMPLEENGALVNRINAEFVKIVRKSGGANEKRWLLLPGVFAVAEPWATRWKASYSWGTEEEHARMDAYFDKIRTAFIDKGIPVILGEYDCLLMNKNPASRIDYFRSIVKHSTDLGICPIFWGNGEERNRYAYVWRQEGVLPALLGK